MSPDEARQRMKALLTKSRKGAFGLSEDEIAKLVDEEVQAVRAQQREKETRI